MMHEETLHDSADLHHKDEEVRKNTESDVSVASLPFCTHNKLNFSNNDLNKHSKGSEVDYPQEQFAEWQHTQGISEHYQTQFRIENLTSNSAAAAAADRALELFSEALMTDSDIECGNVNITAPQFEDISTEKKLPSERRVHFADEPVVDMEQIYNVDQSHAQSSASGYNSYTLQELKSGVEYEAEYLGSTPVLLSDAKLARMQQAEAAVTLVKDPENGSQPRIPVQIKISTEAIKIADKKTNVDLMDHPLNTISFVADVANTLVIMVRLPSSIPRMTCHVLDACNVRPLTLVIGEAFTAAYREFLKLNGIREEDIEDAEFHHVLNAQSASCVELDSFVDDTKMKQIVFHKTPGELMGIVVMESGYGSPIPTCVVAYMDKTGAAAKCGLLNVGDHIISINGVSIIGLPLKTCIHQIKKCKALGIVRMAICSCPPVLELKILRPSVKFQLGFSVQDGIICSLRRGTIAERSGVRVGHKIIEINGISTVDMDHSQVVKFLTNTVGDLHIRTMPYLMYQLITGEISPEYY